MRMVNMYPQWAPYADLDDMLGAGMSLFPCILRAYARILAMSLKSWTPERRDAAVATYHPSLVDAATSTMTRDAETIAGPGTPHHLRANTDCRWKISHLPTSDESLALEPDTSRLYPAPPGFDDFEPMELSHNPPEEVPLGGDEPGYMWPDLPPVGNISAPSSATVTDTEFCRCLEAISSICRQDHGRTSRSPE